VIDLLAILQERGQGLPVRDPPLPGGVAGVLRALFGLPAWLQLSALAVSALAALLLCVVAWRKRLDLAGWLRQRSRAFQAGLLLVVLVVIVAGAAFGRASWHYTQHNNDFCTVCHVMSAPFKKFQLTRHAQIQCHDCHQQSILASLHELRIWLLDRPEAIHATRHTPNERCVSCHVNGDSTRWKQIAATAGHRVHLESTQLTDLQCVRCHGVTVHEFVPVRETCGQSDCHRPEVTNIELGRMAAVDTDLHCTMCHDFLRRTPAHVATDSARQQLTPGRNQCLACHPMETLAGRQFAGNEVHGAACGACHNPHVQLQAAAAVQSCAAAGCHARADTITPFHRGLARGVLDNCTQCHQAHSWAVRGADCLACHRIEQLDSRRSIGPSPHGAAPPDTARSTAAPHPRIMVLERGPARMGMSLLPGWGLLRALLQEVQRPFRHSTHAALQCTRCHASAEQHGALRVRAPADCAACHHAAANQERCAACHTSAQLAGEYSQTVQISMSVWPAPRERRLSFAHERHAALSCQACHQEAPRLAAALSCTGCHVQHHSVARNCTSCHQDVNATSAHDRRVHLSCEGSGCHNGETLPRPVDARAVCLACHATRVNHQPGRECASCHLLRGPPAVLEARKWP
jgi:nitrate/TMAO reductase-like tetraheme cytochrome c subunit